MSREALIQKVMEKTGQTKKDAADSVKAVFDGVTEIVASGEKVALVGFGTFESVHKPESKGRNPQTGEAMTIKARNQPKFKAGKGLKDACNS